MSKEQLRIYQLDMTDKTAVAMAKEQYTGSPLSLLEVSDEDCRHINERIERFLYEYINVRYKFSGYVIGLSGGIDSALAAWKAVDAVGKDRVLGILIPSRNTTSEDITHARMITDRRGISYATSDVGLFEREVETDREIEECIAMQLPGFGIPARNDKKNVRTRIGNDHARTRMKVLRRQANKYNLIVLGTTNWTEAELGYATIAGDGYRGIDIEPLQMLPKTSEWQYTRRIPGFPEEVIRKVPSAGLYPGQTDEGEIGMKYENIDRILTGKALGLPVEDIIRANDIPEINEQSVSEIFRRVECNRFKARPEPFADLRK